MPAVPASSPAGEVPADSREPTDPPPPPDMGGPTTGGPDAGGPATPGGPDAGPSTGGPDAGGPATGGPDAGGPATGGPDPGGPTTNGPTKGGPSSGGGPAPSGPTTGGRRTQARADKGQWSYWWTLNRALVVDLASKVTRAANVTPSSDDATAADKWRAGVRESLLAALSDSDERVREQAAWALGKAGVASDAAVLAAVLDDVRQPQAVREAAAVAIGRLPLGDAAAAAATRRTLQRGASDAKSAPRLRAMCVYALGMRAETESVPFLAGLASDPSPTWDVPAAALTAMGMTGCPLVREDLERHLAPSKTRTASSDLRRVYAAHGLALLRDPASLPALRAAALDDSDDVRRAALLALGAVAPSGDAETVRVLSSAFVKDHDRVCRGMAALSLGRVGGESAATFLRRAHAAGDVSTVRPYIALGLGLIARSTGDDAIAKVLVHDLETNPSEEMSGALAIAVGLARRPEAAPALRSIANEARDPVVRGHAAVALGLVGDAASGPAVLRSLIDVPIPLLQGEAALGLGLLGDADSLASLGDRLEHGTTVNTRAAAAIAIGRIGGPDAARHLTTALKDTSADSLTRVSATVGLGLLLDRTGCRATTRITGDLDWCATTGAVTDVLGEM